MHAGYDPIEVRQEHRRLRAVLDATAEVLRVLAGEKEAPLGSAGGFLLDELRDRLRAHFAYEEQADGFGRLTRESPHLASAIAELERDHRELSVRADALALVGQGAEQDAGLWPRALREFESLRDDLMAHEQRENDTLFAAHHVDLGAH